MRLLLLTVATLLPYQAVLAAGLCAPTEQTYFSCSLTGGGKRVSLCGGSDWLQYRFGAARNIEMAFPSVRAGSLEQFRGARRYHKASQVSADFLMFERSGVRYTLTRMEGGSNFNGVAVEAPGRKAQNLRCDRRLQTTFRLGDAAQLVPEGTP